MQRRRRSKQILSLEGQLGRESQRLREEARSLPPGFRRDQLLRRARQCETGSHVKRVAAVAGLTAANLTTPFSGLTLEPMGCPPDGVLTFGLALR